MKAFDITKSFELISNALTRARHWLAKESVLYSDPAVRAKAYPRVDGAVIFDARRFEARKTLRHGYAIIPVQGEARHDGTRFVIGKETKKTPLRHIATREEVLGEFDNFRILGIRDGWNFNKVCLHDCVGIAAHAKAKFVQKSEFPAVIYSPLWFHKDSFLARNVAIQTIRFVLKWNEDEKGYAISIMHGLSRRNPASDNPPLTLGNENHYKTIPGYFPLERANEILCALEWATHEKAGCVYHEGFEAGNLKEIRHSLCLPRYREDDGAGLEKIAGPFLEYLPQAQVGLRVVARSGSLPPTGHHRQHGNHNAR